MRSYGQSMFGFPQRNDPVGGRIVMLGTSVQAKSSTGANTEFARFKVPGKLMVPGASLNIVGNAQIGATDTILVQAWGRAETSQTLFTLAANDSSFWARIFMVDWNDASSANLRYILLSNPAGTIAFATNTITLLYASDDWELSFRNGAGAVDSRTIRCVSVEMYSPSRYADMSAKSNLV